MARRKAKAEEPKPEGTILKSATGVYPEVKESAAERRAAEFAPTPKPQPDMVTFRMNGGSINPELGGKQYNIRAEKSGLEKVSDGKGNIVFVDMWTYSTSNPLIIEFMRKEGYKEMKF